MCASSQHVTTWHFPCPLSETWPLPVAVAAPPPEPLGTDTTILADWNFRWSCAILIVILLPLDEYGALTGCGRSQVHSTTQCNPPDSLVITGQFSVAGSILCVMLLHVDTASLCLLPSVVQQNCWSQERSRVCPHTCSSVDPIGTCQQEWRMLRFEQLNPGMVKLMILMEPAEGICSLLFPLFSCFLSSLLWWIHHCPNAPSWQFIC